MMTLIYENDLSDPSDLFFHTEYFGRGLIINLRGDNFKLLPASLG